MEVEAGCRIGDRVRRLRRVQGRTLEDLACACECSKSHLSRIETGKVVPAIAHLSRIAKALGVKVSALMEDGHGIEVAVTDDLTDCPEALTPTSKGYAVFAFAARFSDKKMQPFLFVSRKGEVRSHSVSHDGEEFIYILQGEVRIRVGNAQYALKKDESIYFSALEEHGVLPVSDVAVYLDIFAG